jgi:hypothetical protein
MCARGDEIASARSPDPFARAQVPRATGTASLVARAASRSVACACARWLPAFAARTERLRQRAGDPSPQVTSARPARASPRRQGRSPEFGSPRARLLRRRAFASRQDPVATEMAAWPHSLVGTRTARATPLTCTTDLASLLFHATASTFRRSGAHACARWRGTTAVHRVIPTSSVEWPARRPGVGAASPVAGDSFS